MKRLLSLMILLAAAFLCSCSENAVDLEKLSQPLNLTNSTMPTIEKKEINLLNLNRKLGLDQPLEDVTGEVNPEENENSDPGVWSNPIEINKIYYATFFWASKSGNASDNLSGSIQSDYGRLDVVSILGFTEGDYMNAPLNANEIKWTTQPSQQLKGVVVRLDLRMALAEGISPDFFALIYQSGAYETHIPVSELPPSLTSFLEDAPDIYLHSGFAYQGGKCKEGLLSGYWQKQANGTNTMIGYWISPEGTKIAQITAILYPSENTGIVYGGAVNPKTQINHELIGAYDDTGNFIGTYKNKLNNEEGYLTGKLINFDLESNGIFRGTWQAECLY